MKSVSILSFHSGKVDRGVETWVKELSSRLKYIKVISGYSIYNFLNWSGSDIVISTGGRLEVLYARLITRILGKPLVVYGQSGPGADDKWNLICSPDVFVCLTSAQSRWAKKYKMPWTKIRVIPNAVDIKKFKPALKKNRKKKVVLTVGANIPSKRIHLVQKAVAKLKNVEFIAVGPGNPYQVSFEKMPNVYRDADLFCFVPKSHEAFGIVYLEAMATNLPVVATNDPTRREIVGRGGVLVKSPENINILSKTIRNALDKKWGTVPRKQAVKYSWEYIVRLNEKMFVDLSK